MNQTVSIIIRTLPGREHFLDKCLFILSGQLYQDLEPIIVAQYHTDENDVQKINEVIEKWEYFFPKIKFIHYLSQTDTRSHSLNLGIESAAGRYLAFLDDDDKLYPQHYKKLVESLQKTRFAWAYCNITRAEFNKNGQLISRTFPYHRNHYLFTEHLQGNFIPIHAPLIDLERTGVLHFNETLTKLEDYDFWLRLAHKYQPLYTHENSGEYCIRADGTNTVTSESLLTHEEQVAKQKEWDEANLQLRSLKLKQFGWWVDEFIPMQLPQTPVPTHSADILWGNSSALSINILGKIYSSYTWKIIRFGKKINWKLRGKPKKRNLPPADPAAAEKELTKLIFSPAWLMLGPLYALERLFRRK